MARLGNFRAGAVCGALGLSVALLPAWAQTPMTEMNGGNTPSSAPAKPAAAPAPAAPPPPVAAGKPAVPGPAPTDDFVRYGKIMSPNDQPPYPFKLTMPGPGFGELHVPNQGELAMREKLERLATLPDVEIRDQLDKWPAYSKMSLGDQGAMLTKIQQFRDRRTKMAQMKAHQLGLLTLNPQQQAKFEQEYWDRRLQMDRQLSQQFEPTVKASEQKLNEDLFREFSSRNPLAQAPKAPATVPPAAPVIKPTAPIIAAH